MKIAEKINISNYLVGGELKEWNGKKKTSIFCN